MNINVADRVTVTTETEGTGGYQIEETAVSGYQSFVEAFGTSALNGIPYVCTGDDGNWEVGIGDFTGAANVLIRTAVVASSNLDSPVSWGPGVKSIRVDLPASQAVLVGNNLEEFAASAAAARANLGSGATGDSVFQAVSAAEARGILGSTAVGDAVFTTASAVAARGTLGVGATGDNLFTAATASEARGDLGLGDAALRTVGVATANDLPDRADADARYLLSGTSRIEAPVGTVMLFGATPLPSNVTRNDAVSDFGLYLSKSGETLGSTKAGGSWNHSSGLSNGNVGNTTLALSQIPAHSHEITPGSEARGGTGFSSVTTITTGAGATTTSVGGGGSHTHSGSVISSTSGWRWPGEIWAKCTVNS